MSRPHAASATTPPAPAFSLSQARRAAFEHEGYFVAEGLFDGAELAEIRDTFTAQGEKGPVPGLAETGKITDPADPLYRLPRMLHPHRHPDLAVGRLALGYMLDERLRVVLAALMGEEPIAAQSMFYFKPAGSRGQALHQDNTSLKVRPGTCMAAWIAVDDADRENGGMVVVPGTQDMDLLCPDGDMDSKIFFTGGRIDVPQGYEEKGVDLKAGDVLFFNGSLIHGSYPNDSADRFRRALIFHYVPTSCIEAADFYHPLLSFEGEVVSKDLATGGGPCGEVRGGNG